LILRFVSDNAQFMRPVMVIRFPTLGLEKHASATKTFHLTDLAVYTT